MVPDHSTSHGEFQDVTAGSVLDSSCSPSGVLVVFFFSSRRRHTRLQGDWSSDVCSSDLCAVILWMLQAWLPPRSAHLAGSQACNIQRITAHMAATLKSTPTQGWPSN